MSRARYVIGLGSNLGDRTRQLYESLVGLRRVATISTVSSLYETAPVGPPQPQFLNAAVDVTTAHTPRDLLQALLEIERSLGRVRRERWGPRPIDLDILWSPDVVVGHPELLIPHPELARRRFALVPLLELAPEATDPSTGLSYRAALEALPDQGLSAVSKAESFLWNQLLRQLS